MNSIYVHNTHNFCQARCLVSTVFDCYIRIFSTTIFCENFIKLIIMIDPSCCDYLYPVQTTVVLLKYS